MGSSLRFPKIGSFRLPRKPFMVLNIFSLLLDTILSMAYDADHVGGDVGVTSRKEEDFDGGIVGRVPYPSDHRGIEQFAKEMTRCCIECLGSRFCPRRHMTMVTSRCRNFCASTVKHRRILNNQHFLTESIGTLPKYA